MRGVQFGLRYSLSMYGDIQQNKIGLSLTNSDEDIVGEMSQTQIYDAFYDKSKRRLIKVTPEGAENAQELVREVNERKKLLTDNGILTNPYNVK